MERSRPSFRLTLLCTLCWGFAAHGMMMLNKFSFHDDARLSFGIGATISSGRWMLELMKRGAEFVLGGVMYSLPLYNGLISLLLLACAGYFLARTFRVESTLGCVALTGILTAFPVITALFGYNMYTAPYYLAGLCLTLLGTWLICRAELESWYRLVLGCVLCACGIGVYQAYLCVALTMMLLYMMMSLHYDARDRRFHFFYKGFSLVFACVLMVALYVAALKLSLYLDEAALTDYESIDSFGFSGWQAYIDRVNLAYTEFFQPPRRRMRDMYPYPSLRWLYMVILYMGLLLALERARQLFRVKARRGVEFLFLLALLPLAVNFIHVMVDVKFVHSLMVYTKALGFLAFICLLENVEADRRRYPRWLRRFGIALVLGVAVLYTHFANVCYLKAEVLQNEAIAYFTRLVSRIESAPGYDPALPVAFLNEKDKRDPTAPTFPAFDTIRLLPYLFDTQMLLINNYAWRDFMRQWCDYAPAVIEDTAALEVRPEVAAMPRYPADGSVKIVAGAVVVKF